MRHRAPLRHVHPIMVSDYLRLGIRKRDILRNKIQAAQRQTHCNDLRVYGVSTSWLAVFDFRQVIWLSWHSHLPDIVKKTNDHAALFADFRGNGGAQLQQGFGNSDAVFEKSTFSVKMVFCACGAGEPCCLCMEDFNELVYIGFSFCYFCSFRNIACLYRMYSLRGLKVWTGSNLCANPVNPVHSVQIHPFSDNDTYRASQTPNRL
jgi:hypothetical protein